MLIIIVVQLNVHLDQIPSLSELIQVKIHINRNSS